MTQWREKGPRSAAGAGAVVRAHAHAPRRGLEHRLQVRADASQSSLHRAPYTGRMWIMVDVSRSHMSLVSLPSLAFPWLPSWRTASAWHFFVSCSQRFGGLAKAKVARPRNQWGPTPKRKRHPLGPLALRNKGLDQNCHASPCFPRSIP